MLLEVKNLSVQFTAGKKQLTAVNDVSFSLGEQDSLGLVGESGCGKSTTAFALMRLLASNGKISGGQVLLNGVDLVPATDDYIRDIRWKDMAIIFQNAMTAMNPVQKIGDQIVNALRQHENVSRAEAIERAEFIFEKVGISKSRLMQYPHEFSGGMLQRALIAMALVCNPKLLIADEPTTALDVTIQAQILELMQSLQKELGMAIIMITHDLGVVAQMCDEVIVMYAGSICEQGTADEIF